MSQSLNERLAFLKAIKSPNHSVVDIEQLLSSTHLTIAVRRHLHKKALHALILLDIKVSVYHEYTDQSDWEYITCDYQTPSDEHKEIKTQITDLKRLFTICATTDLNVFLNFFECNILMLKTKHVQFLLFQYDPQAVLSFLFNGLLNNHTKGNYFLIYIFSYLIRREMQQTLVGKVVKSLVCSYNKEKNETRKLIFLQGFVYLCCFKNELYAGLEEVINSQAWLLRYINEKIVTVFTGIFGVEVKSVASENPLLEWFPFDQPPVNEVFERYESVYLSFNKTV